MQFKTKFYGEDPCRVGIDEDVTVTINEPREDRGAWTVDFALEGSKRAYTSDITGDTPLQAMELTAKHIRMMYELDADGVPLPRPS